MTKFLEYFRMLNEDEIEEEIDYNLYANYVDTLPIFIDVLQNGHIKANYNQWDAGNKDFDVRGNHICLTHDILNPPRIMPSLQFGLVFNKEKFNELALKNLDNKITSEVNGFMNSDEEGSTRIISQHDDVLYRLLNNEIIDNVKNKSVGMYLVGAISYKNGKKSLLFYNWTERFFPNKDNLVINDVDFTDDLKQGSESLWNKIIECFNNYQENEQCLLYKLGNAARTKEDVERQKEGYPYFDSNVIDFAYCLDIQDSSTHKLGPRFKTSKFKGLDRLIKFQTYVNKELKPKILYPNNNSIDLTNEEIFVLAKMILPEHEFRLYLKNVDDENLVNQIKDYSKEIKQLSNNYNKLIKDPDSLYKANFIQKKLNSVNNKLMNLLKSYPNIFYKFNGSECVERIILPQYYKYADSMYDKRSYILNFRRVYLKFSSSYYSRDMNIDNPKFKEKLIAQDKLLDKKWNLDTEAGWENFMSKINKSNLDINKLYFLVMYTENVIVPSNDINWKRDLNIRLHWYEQLKPILNQVIKLKTIINKNYSDVEIKFYKVDIRDEERFTDYVNDDED